MPAMALPAMKEAEVGAAAQRTEPATRYVSIREAETFQGEKTVITDLPSNTTMNAK
jgi:hypothetical protein